MKLVQSLGLEHMCSYSLWQEGLSIAKYRMHKSIGIVCNAVRSTEYSILHRKIDCVAKDILPSTA